MCHQEDRVHVAGASSIAGVGVLLELIHHFLGDLLASMRPGVEHLVVALAVRNHAALIELHDLQDVLLCGADDLPLVGRGNQIVGSKGQSAPRAPAETDAVHVVEKVDRLAAAQGLIAIGDHSGQFARPHRNVVKEHSFRQDRVEQDTAHGRFNERTGLAERLDVGLQPATSRQLDPNLGMGVDLAERMRKLHFLDILEDHALSLAAREQHREVVATHHHVLRRADDRRAIRGAEDVVGGEHQRVSFHLCLDGQRQVDGHLVAVKVGVEALADKRMQLDRIALDEHRFECLDAHAMERGGTIQKHRMVADDLFEDVPHLGVLPLEHLLGALDRVSMTELLEPPDDERLIELQGDLFRQAALMQPKIWTNHDHASRRVIDALSKQVLAEPTLLALDHVGEALQRAVAGCQHRPLAAVVVEEGVHRLLQHPLLVADDHLGRIQVDQLFEPVVPVDDATIEVIQVTRGEVARIEHHKRTEVGWDHGDHDEHDPLGLVFAVANGLDDLQPIDEVLLLLLAVGRGEFDAKILGKRHEVEGQQKLANSLRAHFRLEGTVTIRGTGLAKLLFRKHLLLLERSILGIEHHVILEVDDLFQA